ncbi:poly(ADP-ribose) glycohydrolase-like isoform X2 [Neodiprion fabricii]|uniref:poly(ADP-ribose) glycohydrolase-like isoform X2 n=1 Tax=Neodiprion fabricii TaxID=2872261 RepID=UPI001ED93908|nr:poly(ADP-ribose) glycohydrolase-like isoform X2 [Neodiprion fabricii]XP_046432932.1 poly(ADP-ribose) glycohydrolase-like isoform X2 [Neodiprion fabricii]
MADTNKPISESVKISMEEDYQLSPDIFSDDNVEASNSSEVSDRSTNEPEWKGISMDEIQKGLAKYGHEQMAPIVPAPRHTVLFVLPLTGEGPPKPYRSQQKDKWCPGYVRMPHSTHSLYPNKHTTGSSGFRQRWEVIQEALLRSFASTHQLEVAILSYNEKYALRWDFSALHYFFSEVIDEDETGLFYDDILPKIVQLALQLPALVTSPIPLLKRHTNVTLSLSQLQVGSLLANALLCTFPRRNSTNPQSEYAMYPEINFNRLFGAYEKERPDRSEAVMEKMKCIFHYFRRIIAKAPDGVITIQRRYVPKENCPRWNRQDIKLPHLHITSNGTIESEGAGLLQVDFANKYIGGGVLGWGCVQEEIRFVICPELMASMLVAEALDDTEALIITGVERYSNYEGYSDTFKWTGNFNDETPRDSSGRRRTSVVAIDALLFKQSHTQFTVTNIIRELNKAYAGFSSSEIPRDKLSAIATGNWGCGAFRGDPQLKVLLQLMAAAVAGRAMVYFTFGDVELRNKVAAMYWHLIERNISIGQLFGLLCDYHTSASKSNDSSLDFYHFLYKRSKIKPLTNYFDKINSNMTTKEQNTISYKSKSVKNDLNKFTNYTSSANVKEALEREQIEKWLDEDFFDEDFSNDLILDTNSGNSNVNSVIRSKKSALSVSKSEMKNNEASTEVVKNLADNDRKNENKDNGSESMPELSTPPIKLKNSRDLTSLLYPDDEITQDTRKVKKPRLSGLDLIGRRSHKPVEKQTLEELPISSNKVKNDSKEIKKTQKKISDFFS